MDKGGVFAKRRYISHMKYYFDNAYKSKKIIKDAEMNKTRLERLLHTTHSYSCHQHLIRFNLNQGMAQARECRRQVGVVGMIATKVYNHPLASKMEKKIAIQIMHLTDSIMAESGKMKMEAKKKKKAYGHIKSRFRTHCTASVKAKMVTKKKKTLKKKKKTIKVSKKKRVYNYKAPYQIKLELLEKQIKGVAELEAQRRAMLQFEESPREIPSQSLPDRKGLTSKPPVSAPPSLQIEDKENQHVETLSKQKPQLTVVEDRSILSPLNNRTNYRYSPKPQKMSLDDSFETASIMSFGGAKKRVPTVTRNLSVRRVSLRNLR